MTAKTATASLPRSPVAARLREASTLVCGAILVAHSASCQSANRWMLRQYAPHAAAGSYLLNQGHCDRAITEWRASIEHREIPEHDGGLHLGIAECEVMLRDFDNARVELEFVAKQYPDHASEAHLWIANLRHQTGDFEGVGESIDEAIRTVVSDRDRERAAAAETALRMLRSARDLQSAREFGDCERAAAAAAEVLRSQLPGAVDVGTMGTYVGYVRPGGNADLAGIVEGDQLLAIDGAKVAWTEDILDVRGALRGRYGQTISVEVLRRGVAGDAPRSRSPIERRLNIQVHLEPPEVDVARRFLHELSERGVQTCQRLPGAPPGDTIPPRILVLEPKVRDLRMRPVVASGATRVAVLASDDTDLTSVEIDDRPARSETPSPVERTLLPGHTLKFAADVTGKPGRRKVVVRATDRAGNRTESNLLLEIVKAAPSETPLFDHSVALVVGIDAYLDAPPLEAAVADARAVAAHLRQAGFQRVIEMYNADATRDRILRALADQLPAVLGPEDRLFVFFAGHGETETLPGEELQEGYLIPVDGNAHDFRGTSISMTKIHEIAGRLRAKHVLFAFDSCYSGLGLKRSLPSQAGSGFIRKLASQRAVEIITAGGKDEKAAERGGHGIFTRYLLEGLNGAADGDDDGYVTGGELGIYVRRRVSDASNNEQTPLFGWLAGEGDLVFEVHPES